MFNSQTITLIIIALAILLLLTGRLRADLVALLVTVSLGLSGVLSAQEAFSGFSRSAVITIIAIFVLTEGLNQAGVTEKAGELLIRLAGQKERSLVLSIMITGALLSLFMNNIAAASVLLPAISGVAQRVKINPSRLLMPLGFATILGGMATLLTTTNIVVSSLLRDNGLNGFGLLEFAPLGFPLIIIGILYMLIWGRHQIHSQPPDQQFRAMHKQEDLIGIYRLEERLHIAKIPKTSPLDGVTLEQSQLRQKFNFNIVAIQHNGSYLPAPSPSLLLHADDILFIETRTQSLCIEETTGVLEWKSSSQNCDEKELVSEDIVLNEVILTPRSKLIGETLRKVNFREKYGMNVIAIWRKGQPLRTGLSDIPLQFGDALLLQGSKYKEHLLSSSLDIISLSKNWKALPAIGKTKKIMAVIIMLLTLGVAATGMFSVGEVMLGGALAMIVSGILNMDQAYQAIEWKSVFLVAGMLPLGVAMNKTGAATSLGFIIEKIPGITNPTILLAILMIIAIVLTQVLNGTSVATVIVPVAIFIAQHTGMNPRMAAMGIAMASSMAFITPLGHPVNILMMSPGGYRFRDFFKVGLPLTLILFLFIIFYLPRIMP